MAPRYLRPTGERDRSHWRRRSNEVIDRVFAENPELVKDPDRYKELRKLVSKAYPFGQRQHWPYKAWRGAVRDRFYKLAMQDLANERGPLFRPCPACKAKPGEHCKPFHECDADPVWAHLMIISDAELDGRPAEDLEKLRAMRPMHESRNPPPPTMPLFAGIEGA